MSIYRPTCLLGLIGVILTAPVAAQIVPDGSVGTTVTPDVMVNGVMSEVIDGGTVKGANLFHSFSEFNIQTGRGAYFTNPEGITNIFSRITGANPSNINGILGVLGNANLFLLNPNGIIFGPNARLDLNGSFLASTASSINFADGVEFSATNPKSSPLLTVSVPVGLQMGQNSAPLTVQGTGHRMTGGIWTPLDRNNNPIGLQVGVGHTLALMGNGVNSSGGVVTTNGGGHLEVGSVSAGSIGLNPTGQGWVGDYSAVSQFNDIHLARQSLLDASGSNSSIQIQGQNISLSEGSAAIIQNLGTQTSGGMTVRATGNLKLTGNTSDGQSGSLLQLENLGAGQTGDLTLSAAQLFVQNGARIVAQTFTQAPGSNLRVDVAGDIDINGVASSNPRIFSIILSMTLNSGNGGNMTVSANNLRLLNGGSLASSAIQGSGQAGMVRVTAADSIEIAGNNPITLAPSTINSATLDSGNANNVFINTSRLVVRDGASIGSNTVSKGSASSVTINASQSVEVTGRAAGSSEPSRIVSTAEIVDPATQAAYGLPPIPSGNAGSLTINTPSLRVTDGAIVSVKNDGPGQAGDIQINASSMVLDTQGRITASTASGNGGDIRLNLQDNLQMRHNSLISATAAGAGNGGNVSVDAPTIVGLENSDIIANAVQGAGGNIQINTQGIFGLENRPQLTPESDISASSQFGVSGTVNVSVLNVNQHNVVAPPPSNFVSTDQVVANSCLARQGKSQGTFAIAGNGGLPETPETRTIPYQVVQVRPLQTQATPSSFERSRSVPSGGSQAPTPSWKFGDPIIEATEFSVNAQGQVVLTAKGYSATGANAHPQPIPCEPNLFK
jgi:filamentous hemagglutinin family protein